MKRLTCTVKVNTLEKALVFPRLQKYTAAHGITVVLQAEGKGVYKMDATGKAETIDNCVGEIQKMSAAFPGRISNIKVVIA